MAMQGLNQMANPPDQEVAYVVFSPRKSQPFSSMQGWGVGVGGAPSELSVLQT